MPTAAENKKPPAIAVADIGAGQPVTTEMVIENRIPAMMPAIPPLTLRNTASAKNWNSTWERCAPIAIRRPISRVRSVTETSRMFHDADAADQ